MRYPITAPITLSIITAGSAKRTTLINPETAAGAKIKEKKE